MMMIPIFLAVVVGILLLAPDVSEGSGSGTQASPFDDISTDAYSFKEDYGGSTIYVTVGCTVYIEGYLHSTVGPIWIGSVTSGYGLSVVTPGGGTIPYLEGTVSQAGTITVNVKGLQSGIANVTLVAVQATQSTYSISTSASPSNGGDLMIYRLVPPNIWAAAGSSYSSATVGDSFKIVVSTQSGYTYTGLAMNGSTVTTSTEYEFTMPYSNVSFVASFTVDTPTHTITWENYDGTVLETDTVAEGAMPRYDGATPTHPQYANYSYTFSGWSPSVTTVTGDQTYTAQFTRSLRYYTVTFSATPSGTGITSWTYSMPYGTTYSLSGDNIVFTYNNSTYYTAVPPSASGYLFRTWSGNSFSDISIGDTITGSKTLYCRYVSTTEYTVSFTTSTPGVTVPSSVQIHGGTSYTSNGSTGILKFHDTSEVTINAPTAPNGYAFYYFNPQAGTVSSDMSIELMYVTTSTPCTVTLVSNIQSITISPSTVSTTIGTTVSASGDTLTFSDNQTVTAPSRTGFTVQWPLPTDPMTITGDTTLTAYYTGNTYTITWKNYNGAVLDTDSVAYGDVPHYTGSTPTRPSSGGTTYTFVGWSPTPYAANSNQEYVAQYTSSTSYTIRWLNYDGTVLETDTVTGGTVPTFNGNTPTKPDDANYGYEFVGWSPTPYNADSDQDYTAQFTTTSLTTYTLSVTVNGALLSTATAYTGGSPDWNEVTLPATLHAGVNVKVVASTELANAVFVNWTLNGTEVATTEEYTFTMPSSDCPLIANYRIGCFAFIHMDGQESVLKEEMPSWSTVWTVSGNSITFTNNGTTVTTITVPSTQTGLVFQEWTDVSRNVITTGTMIDETNFYARYLSSTTYTVNFESNVQGVTLPSSIQVHGGTRYVSNASTGVMTFNDTSDITVNAPTAPSGYVFSGFSPQAGTVNDALVVTFNYASTAQTCTVNLVSNLEGVTFSPSSLTMSVGTTATANGYVLTFSDNQTVTAPETEGYTFRWALATDPYTITGNTYLTGFYTEVIPTATVSFSTSPDAITTFESITVPLYTEYAAEGNLLHFYDTDNNVIATVTAPQTVGGYEFRTWHYLSGSITSTEASNYASYDFLGSYTYWENGEQNASVSILFALDSPTMKDYNLSFSANLNHFTGTVSETDSTAVFESTGNRVSIAIGSTHHANEYDVTLTASIYAGSALLKTYTYDIGSEKYFIVDLNVYDEYISVSRLSRFNSFTSYTVMETARVLDWTSDSHYDDTTISLMSFTTEGTAPRQQVVSTSVFLNTYGIVMKDPTLDVNSIWQNDTDIRLNFYSFALYGKSMTINGITFPVTGSTITIPYQLKGRDYVYDADATNSKTYNLTNVSFTWQNGHAFISFNNENRMFDLGEYSDRVISFEGNWYFTSGWYRSYTVQVSEVTKNWWDFDFDFTVFGLILAGLLTMVGVYMRLKTRAKGLDYALIIGGIVLALIIAGGFIR